MNGLNQTKHTATDKIIERRPLPIIDVGPVIKGDDKAIYNLVDKWRDVWQSVGFMCIINHGVPKETIRKMESEAKRFHDLPLEVKMSVPITTDQKGYAPAYAAITTHSEYH